MNIFAKKKKGGGNGRFTRRKQTNIFFLLDMCQIFIGFFLRFLWDFIFYFWEKIFFWEVARKLARRAHSFEKKLINKNEDVLDEKRGSLNFYFMLKTIIFCLFLNLYKKINFFHRFFLSFPFNNQTPPPLSASSFTTLPFSPPFPTPPPSSLPLFSSPNPNRNFLRKRNRRRINQQFWESRKKTHRMNLIKSNAEGYTMESKKN